MDSQGPIRLIFVLPDDSHEDFMPGPILKSKKCSKQDGDAALARIQLFAVYIPTVSSADRLAIY